MSIKGKKILVLPEILIGVNSGGGPLSVVKKMHDVGSEHYNFVVIDKRIVDRFCLKNIMHKIKSSIIWTFIFYFHVKRIRYALGKVIRSNDFVISHEVFYSYVVKRYFPKVKLLHVSHQQGSNYYEATDLLGIRSGSLLRKYLEMIELFVYEKADFLGFPSWGAKDSLIKTNSNLDKMIRNKKQMVFYNGVDTKKKGFASKELSNIITEKNGYVFITVASLNKAKGVDRVPAFLSKLKERGVKFQWILVGDGILRRKISNLIKKYGLEGNIKWIAREISHEEVIYLFEKSDFYILFHRFSVFDLATLEAMSKGCVPILSNIGGNKEVIVNNNGILLDDLCDANIFLKFVNKKSLEFYKEMNKKIILEKFSNDKFIERYNEFAKVLIK